jgi:hypothetical protein
MRNCRFLGRIQRTCISVGMLIETPGILKSQCTICASLRRRFAIMQIPPALISWILPSSNRFWVCERPRGDNSLALSTEEKRTRDERRCSGIADGLICCDALFATIPSQAHREGRYSARRAEVKYESGLVRLGCGKFLG